MTALILQLGLLLDSSAEQVDALLVDALRRQVGGLQLQRLPAAAEIGGPLGRHPRAGAVLTIQEVGIDTDTCGHTGDGDCGAHRQPAAAILFGDQRGEKARRGQRVDEGDARDGFLLDGFPRNESQADALAQALAGMDRKLTAALSIEVPDEEVVRRLSGRRVCVKNPTHIYHVDFDPPKHEGVCDQDGARLIQRDDDKEETIRRRLEVYHSQTEPLLAYYDKLELLRRFDGSRSPDEVHAHVRATVATLRMEENL